MSSWAPLFVTGPARSGSTLLAQMLAAHPEIAFASDPYLPLFRALRNSIVRQHGSTEQAAGFDPSSPLQDYYFTDARIALMDLVQDAELRSIEFDEDWDEFLERSRRRALDESPDLAPQLDRLRAATYQGMFDAALQLIAELRPQQRPCWVGFKEVWTVEFCSVLAQAYPTARFIILLRDPRAIVASMLALGQQHPDQVAHTLSYVRHWRKYVAFTMRFANTPALDRRFFVSRYEDLVSDPWSEAKRLCAFLQVGADHCMVDSERYVDARTGGTWAGNSSFDSSLLGITPKLVDVWRQSLPPRALSLVELVCSAEMLFLGYTPETVADDFEVQGQALDQILREHEAPLNWRSDLGDPQADFGSELLRRVMLKMDQSVLPSQLVRRAFLFEDVLTKLQSASQVVAC